MRSVRLTPFAALVPLFAAVFGIMGPSLAFAQFQQPTQDELRMTSDPRYPGAGAIILNYEERADDIIHFTSRYERVKILSESAKELATFHIDYERGISEIAAVQARTIHADGTVVPLNVKPADLMEFRQGSSESHDVVVNLPSVEVGSILEFYYQIRYGEKAGGYEGRGGLCTNPQWDVQQKYPVRKAHYVFVPCDGILNAGGLGGGGVLDEHNQVLHDLLWFVNLPDKKTLQPNAAGRFDLTVTDVPPMPAEPWMPPTESQKYQVRFYYSSGTSGDQFWAREAHYVVDDANRFGAVTGPIQQAASSLVAPSDSDMDKARKLYAAVQALDNTDFTRQKTSEEIAASGFRMPRRAEDTWAQKSGSGQDMVMLYLALLRAAGLKAYPMKVVDRARNTFNANFLNVGQLTAWIVILDIGGKETVLDPAEKMCPFEVVSWRHSGTGGLRQTASGAGLGVSPLLPYSANLTVRRANLTVNPNGSVTGKLNFTFTGQAALHWRQLALRSSEDALDRSFDEWLTTQIPAGTAAHVTGFTNLDNLTPELQVECSVTGTPGTTTGKRILLPASFFQPPDARTFIAQPNRTLPVDLKYAAQVKDGVLFHPPAGYTVEGSPADANIPWAGHAVYLLKPTSGANGVNVGSAFTRAFTFLDPAEYGQLRDFYQKVSTASQQQIVFAASAPAAGN